MAFSFLNRKKQHDAAPYLRRLVDLTIPNPPVASEYRSGRRYNRSIPVMVGPFDPNGENQSDFQFAITKDIVDLGLGIITTHELDMDEVTIAFWLREADMETPYFFRGTIQGCTPIGGPFWQVGLGVEEFLNADYPMIVERLTPVVAQLVRRAEVSLAEPTA